MRLPGVAAVAHRLSTHARSTDHSDCEGDLDWADLTAGQPRHFAQADSSGSSCHDWSKNPAPTTPSIP